MKKTTVVCNVYGFSTRLYGVLASMLCLLSCPSYSLGVHNEGLVYGIDGSNIPSAHSQGDIGYNNGKLPKNMKPGYIYGQVVQVRFPQDNYMLTAPWHKSEQPCAQTPKAYSMEVYTNPSHPNHYQAIVEAEVAISTCRLEKWNEPSGPYGQWVDIAISTKDKLNAGQHRVYWLLFLDYMQGPSASCSAEIPDMRFGTINKGSSSIPESLVSVLVTCDRKVSLKYEVNYGKPLSVKKEKTIIEFINPDGPDKSVTCRKSCSLEIIGRMTSKPQNEGAYIWSVPVIITYN